MAQLTRIADRDRAWFRDRAGRQHRARDAEPAERQAFGGDRDLVLLIRDLGRGVLVYQPVILSRPLPVNEQTIARMFARAVGHPLMIPTFEEPVEGCGPPKNLASPPRPRPPRSSC